MTFLDPLFSRVVLRFKAALPRVVGAELHFSVIFPSNPIPWPPPPPSASHWSQGLVAGLSVGLLVAGGESGRLVWSGGAPTGWLCCAEEAEAPASAADLAGCVYAQATGKQHDLHL